MGRQKVGGSPGSYYLYYDEADSGPDQQLPSGQSSSSGGGSGSGGYTPPEGYTLSPGESGAEANDWIAPFLPGGSPVIPPTAESVTPQQISPSTFQPYQPAPGMALLPGESGAEPNDWYSLLSKISAPLAPAPPVPLTPSAAPTPNPSAPNQGAPLGFDPTKWFSDYSSEKYIVGRIIARGGSSAEAAAAIGGTLVGPDLIRLPSGEIYDVIYDREGVATPLWHLTNPTTPTPAPTPAPRTTPTALPTATRTGTGTGTGTGTPTSGLDMDALMRQLQPFLAPQPSRPALPSGYGGPGPALQPGLNQVGQQPLDQLMSSALAGLIENGGTPYGQNIAATLEDLIQRGGVTPAVDRQLIGARDAEAMAMQGMLADARANLASRGLASTPGAPQGAEGIAVDRLSEQLAPTFANAISGIESHAIDVGNQSLMDALGMATGLSRDQTSAVLQSIGTGTARQQVLANIALDSLAQNIDWNKFLATYGLQHDQIAEQLAQGRLTSIIPLLQMFLQLAGQSAQGFIGAGGDTNWAQA